MFIARQIEQNFSMKGERERGKFLENEKGNFASLELVKLRYILYDLFEEFDMKVSLK